MSGIRDIFDIGITFIRSTKFSRVHHVNKIIQVELVGSTRYRFTSERSSMLDTEFSQRRQWTTLCTASVVIYRHILKFWRGPLDYSSSRARPSIWIQQTSIFFVEWLRDMCEIQSRRRSPIIIWVLHVKINEDFWWIIPWWTVNVIFAAYALFGVRIRADVDRWIFFAWINEAFDVCASCCAPL